MKALAMLLAALAAGTNAQGSGDEGAVLATVNGVFEAMRKGDSTIVRPLFHSRARLITAGATSPGVRIEESADDFIKFIGTAQPGAFNETLSNVKVNIDGSLASVWADYKFFRGATLSHCGVDHFLLVKEGGSWKIIELADTRRREGC